MTIWITATDEREVKTRIAHLSGDSMATSDGHGSRLIRIRDIKRVRVRHSDSVINGALIGTGAAVASGLFLCSLTETLGNCADDVGPIFRIGAIGAAVGIGIDALIRGRKTIYEAPHSSTRLRATPIVARHAGGLQISFSF
jgi:hypothetical protein